MRVISRGMSLVCLAVLTMNGCALYTPPTVSSIDTAAPTLSCPSPQPGLLPGDFAGTWMATYWGGTVVDTISLRPDGTYKQVVDSVSEGLHYESPWREWWVEVRESGYPRLHLAGMRRCDELLETCLRTQGGTDSQAFDYCENLSLAMPDSVILVVTGPQPGDRVPRELLLRQTRIAGSEWSYYFSLVSDVPSE